jgi:hypothetical protein
MDVIILLVACFGCGVVVGMLLRPRSREYREMDQRKKMQIALDLRDGKK